MTQEKFEQATELLEIIKITESQIKNLYKFRDSKREDREDRHYDDGLYNLCISRFSDGSGGIAELTRYQGNSELLDVIIETLQKQLKEFKEEFERI